MSTYAAAEQRDRWKAMLAAVVATGTIGTAIVAGLNVETVRTVVERLKTFNLAQPPPPPPIPLPRPRARAARKPAGASAPKQEPAPVVAPTPKIPAPSPLPAAKVAGTGSASSSGAGASGIGTGAGGSGNGAGGGGTGDYSRFTPAQLVRNLTRGDYREIAQGRLPSGRAMVSLRIEPTGVPSNCRILRSSGDTVVDGGLCPLIEARLRFRPALDDQGRPIPYQLQYVATWNL